MSGHQLYGVTENQRLSIWRLFTIPIIRRHRSHGRSLGERTGVSNLLGIVYGYGNCDIEAYLELRIRAVRYTKRNKK